MLLPEILKLWDDARAAFKQARVWARARRLGLSQLACLERHTMTGLLCSCGRQFVDGSADYRVFSKDRWEPDQLFRPVIRGSLSHLPESHPVIVAVDGSYTNKSMIGGLPHRTTLIGRIRRDAKLHLPHPQSPRWYGPQAPTPEELRKDEQYPWEDIQGYAAGTTHTFRAKTLVPLRWRKTGTTCALRVVVIAPVGYCLRKGSRLLYRQPAYLICTDPELSVQKVVQYYLWRWDIEVNHRDEKQIVGIGQAQVWSPKSVDRQPAFAVASYAMLLLAATNAFGPDAVEGLLPVPKWQDGCSRNRITTQQLVQQLRQEVWGNAIDQIATPDACDNFVTPEKADTKSSHGILAPTPPLAFARSG